MRMNQPDLIQKIEDFIEKRKSLLNKLKKAEKHLIIELTELIEEPDLTNALIDNSKDFFDAGIEVTSRLREPNQEKIPLRIKGILPSMLLDLRNVRVKHLDKFWGFKGMIRQISDVRALVTKITYECPSCGQVISITITDPNWNDKIIKCGCGRKGKMKEIDTKLIDTQRMIIEEKPEMLEGQQPKRLNILLQEGLTSEELDKITTPGSEILVTGILSTFSPDPKKKWEKEFVLLANFIHPIEQTYKDIEITDKDKEEIIKLSKKKNLIEIFKDSYAPDVYGYDIVKKAIILQLFGAVPVYQNNKKVRRENFHLMLVGDPGLSKSLLAKYAGNLAPKYRYVSCSRASGAGLTAIVIRDEFLGGWFLEAGALVLASGGLCVVDEFDKLNPEDRGKINEALENQCITTDKANIHASMVANTSLLAIANPKHKRFDIYSPLHEQIGVEIDILSRFDLIFAITDTIDEKRDSEVIAKILDVHTDMSKIQPKISSDFLRKYIAYAKENIHPQLTPKAKSAIKEIYLLIRKKSEKSITITPRQGEAILRLSQAAAKLRLSNKVDGEDVELAKGIMFEYLKKMAMDFETGQIDIDKIEIGITSSERSRREIVLKAIKDEEEITGTAPIDKVIAICNEKGMEDNRVEEIIEKLKRYGEIMEPRPGFFKCL